MDRVIHPSVCERGYPSVSQWIGLSIRQFGLSVCQTVVQIIRPSDHGSSYPSVSPVRSSLLQGLPALLCQEAAAAWHELWMMKHVSGLCYPRHAFGLSCLMDP